LRIRRPPAPTLFPYTTLFRSKPETKREVVEPAVFKEVTRWVLEAPARVVEVPVANETAELPVQVVAQAEKVDEQQVPAEVRQLRSEEHTSELQSRENLVCRLL